MRRPFLPLCLAAVLVGCAPGSDLDRAHARDDSLTELLDLYRNGKGLDLGDLMSVASDFATDKLNDALAVSDYASIRVSPTELYALSSVAKEDSTLQDVDALVSGLVTRYGERELTTEVNAVRRRELADGAATVYGESAFRIGAGHDWSLWSGGIGDGGSIRLGFAADASLEARVIGAYPSEWKALVKSPLSAIKSARGFVLPRSAADVAAMKPGESMALHGGGVLGANLGVGVPILVATPGSFSYSIVLSAGLRAALEGDVDVQLVRLDGDEAVVDVGVQNAKVAGARIAIHDGWGVHGLVKTHVSVGGFDLDLGKLAEGALERRVLDKLSLVSATLESTSRTSRLSVARLRFSLDKATPGSPVEKALAQALRADVRLAQALANADEPGVTAEFELSRSGISSASYAGIDVFGMSFFRKVQQKEGSVVVQTPGGARTLLFESLHKSKGWFFSSHGYTRVGLSGLVVDAAEPTHAEGEANLFLQIVEGDDYMERDKMLDHIDGVIRSVAGDAALAAIEVPGNDLERWVVQKCPNSQAFDPCRTKVLSDPTVVSLRQKGLDALAAQLGGLEPKQRDLVLAAGKLRLTAQATLEPAASLVGPPTSVVLDYRLDDGALTELFERNGGDDMAAAVRAHVALAEVDRQDDPGAFAADKSKHAAGAASMADAMARVYADHAARYLALRQAEGIELERHPELGTMKARAVEIRLPVGKDGRPDYEAAAVQALPQARASVATHMFDELLAVADVSGAPHPEQTVAYALLAMTAGPRKDLRLTVSMDMSTSWAQDFDHYQKAGYSSFDAYARGSFVSPIDGGLFNVDDLIDVEK